MGFMLMLLERVAMGAAEELGASFVRNALDLIASMPAVLWWPLGMGVATAGAWVGVANAVHADPCRLWAWLHHKERLTFSFIGIIVLLVFIVSFELGSSAVPRFSFYLLLSLLAPFIIDIYIMYKPVDSHNAISVTLYRAFAMCLAVPLITLPLSAVFSLQEPNHDHRE